MGGPGHNKLKVVDGSEGLGRAPRQAKIELGTKWDDPLRLVGPSPSPYMNRLGQSQATGYCNRPRVSPLGPVQLGSN
ncbi:hypothetical protein TorRG33x02_034900 [Trema orientale]|uniref:Uncharacterized protein n=1 Tax=Trema orientale TaxID=63057 RepID=A0A2P5FSW2_TREOI|nr:hypothetical protein TorRG33x02_034900 [Trema orientale]